MTYPSESAHYYGENLEGIRRGFMEPWIIMYLYFSLGNLLENLY